MNPRKTLITPNELSLLTPVSRNYPGGQLSSVIPFKEEQIFRVYLGYDFYQDLIADLQTYIYTEWNNTTIYPSDSVVLHLDVLWKTPSGASAGSAPFVGSSVWEYADKFSNANYNTFWMDYLRYFIAWTVVQGSAVYKAIELAGLGAIRGKGTNSNSRPASLREIQTLKEEFHEDIMGMLYNIHQYLTTNSDIFPNYRWNQSGDNCSNPPSFNGARKDYGFSF